MRRTPKKLATSFFGVAAAALVLAGCTIQLAPNYDASIVAGLNTANTQTQTMFATVSSGATKETYVAAREAQYNAIIGQFSALDAQVAARAVPQPPSFFTKPALPPSDVSQIQRLNAPSKDALDHIVVTLTKMRDTDAAMGLAAGTCPGSFTPSCGFKQDYMQNFDSALTYESALQR
jgi:hypothetical protein